MELLKKTNWLLLIRLHDHGWILMGSEKQPDNFDKIVLAKTKLGKY